MPGQRWPTVKTESLFNYTTRKMRGLSYAAFDEDESAEGFISLTLIGNVFD